MKLRISLAALVIAALSGCSTFGNLDSGLSALNGRNIHDAINVLGYPASQQQIAGQTVYTWSIDNSTQYQMPNTTTTSGYAGGVPFSATTTGTQAVNMSYLCTIKLGTDSDGRIVNYDWSGNLAGCDRW